MSKYVGLWHIYEMDMWDKDYFNMEVQAYISIKNSDNGDFQFGLVTGEIDGSVESDRLSFTFDGCDENDPATGSGWIKLEGRNEIAGMFKFHMGDHSGFRARKKLKN